MKYLFFFSAVLAIFPSTVMMLCSRKLIRWATLGLSIPLLMFNSTAINFFSQESYRGTARGMEISIIYIIAFTILLALTIMRGPRKIFPDWGSKIYLLYFLLSLPSLNFAANKLFCFLELWKMIMIYLVFLAVYHYLEFSGGDFDSILYGIMIVVAVNFFKIVLQHFQGVYQVYGFFPHQNSLAMYMQLAGMIFFSRYFNLAEGRKSKLFFILFALASIALVRTYSRGALACYPIAGFITLACSIWHKFSIRKVHITVILAFIGMIALTIAMPRIIDRFQKAPESSGLTRKHFAIAAVNMMKDHPFAGVGINNWGIKINPPYDYSRHREKMHYNEDYKDGIVETIYLLVGAECGIPCLLVLLSWFGYYVFSSLRLMKRLRGTPYFYIPAGALGGMIGIYLQSCLEWVLKQQINFMLLITVFAFLSYLNRHYRELSAAAQVPKPDPAQIEKNACGAKS